MGVVELDLADLEFLDSAGLDALADTEAALRSRGWTVRLSEARPLVTWLLDQAVLQHRGQAWRQVLVNVHIAGSTAGSSGASEPPRVRWRRRTNERSAPVPAVRSHLRGTNTATPRLVG